MGATATSRSFEIRRGISTSLRVLKGLTPPQLHTSTIIGIRAGYCLSRIDEFTS